MQLRRQYRCHPAIGSLASCLFYGGQLINGVTEDQRNSFIKGFAPIMFFDVASGVESANESGSFVNNEVGGCLCVSIRVHLSDWVVGFKEATFVKSLVLGMLEAGVKASQVSSHRSLFKYIIYCPFDGWIRSGLFASTRRKFILCKRSCLKANQRTMWNPKLPLEYQRLDYWCSRALQIINVLPYLTQYVLNRSPL